MYAYSEMLSNERKKYLVEYAKSQGCARVKQTMAFVRDTESEKVLMSYDTVIGILKKDGESWRYLYVDYYSFDCSNTTIRHFSKWLYANNLPSYQTIKKYAKRCEAPGTGELFYDSPNDKIVVLFM